LPGTTAQTTAAAICIKQPQPIDAQHERLVWAMAGFSAGESAEALALRADEQPEGAMLAVSGMN
jgi:hypothetical protein